MAEYLKQDSELGYVEDSAMIQYLKFNNMRHTIIGCMLGDFDENGQYVVSEQIKQELIAMRKYIVETDENIDICHSVLKLDKQISFAVTFENDAASLVLLEKLSFNANIKLNSGTYSNIVETVLDSVETSGEIDKNLIYTKWNISKEPEEPEDVFKMSPETLALYAGLVDRFKYLMVANQQLLEKEEELEEIESEYAMEMMDAISHYPDLQRVVFADIRQAMKEGKDFLKLDKPNFAKTLNEIIMQSVENNVSVLEGEALEQFNNECHNVQNGFNIRMEEAVPVDHQQNASEDARLTDSVPLVKLDIGDVMVGALDLKEVTADMLASNRKASERVQDRLGEVLGMSAPEQTAGQTTGQTMKSRLVDMVEGVLDMPAQDLVTEESMARLAEQQEHAVAEPAPAAPKKNLVESAQKRAAAAPKAAPKAAAAPKAPASKPKVQGQQKKTTQVNKNAQANKPAPNAASPARRGSEFGSSYTSSSTSSTGTPADGKKNIKKSPDVSNTPATNPYTTGNKTKVIDAGEDVIEIVAPENPENDHFTMEEMSETTRALDRNGMLSNMVEEGQNLEGVVESMIRPAEDVDKATETAQEATGAVDTAFGINN